MLKKLYTRFIQSSEDDPDVRNREIVLNCILIGLIGLIILTAINSFYSLVFKHERYVLWRFLLINILLIFFCYLYWYSRRKLHHKVVGLVVVGLMFCLASLVLIKWGLQDPIASSLFCLTIVMAGILLGARYSLHVVVVIATTFLILILFDARGLLRPDLSWTQRHISIGDSASFVTLFAIIALVSWLFNRQMEYSLKRAQHSERALKRQRDLLEIKVEERTRELQDAQLQKIQQFYRFAELGHLSTAFFHDLANFSTSLGIDAEGLNSGPKPDIVVRIQKNIRYINDVVRRVNLHLRTKQTKQDIDVNKQIKEVISIINYSAQKQEVTTIFKPRAKKLVYRCDVTRFRQLVMNLVSNGIEAYGPATASNTKPREVVVEALLVKSNLLIRVTDFGKGIAESKREKIFEPFFSAKAEGTGIGLFIVRQVVEQDFKGKIKLTSDKQNGTTFTITLPLKHS